jgi:hypothetical protein
MRRRIESKGTETNEDVGTSTLEEGSDTLSLDDLATGVDHAVVVDLLTRGHHHATTDGVEGVRGDTGTGGDTPTEEEGGEEGTLKLQVGEIRFRNDDENEEKEGE